jgi:mono/diheme cytochrome c family protein
LPVANWKAEKMMRACSAALLAAVLAVTQTARADATTEGASPPLTEVGIASAWRTLRAVDCARCHGKHYEGLAAPSIVNYARTQSREMFVRMVLDGDPPRGMPGYRTNAWVANSIDDIYLYFHARANGTIDPDSRPKSPEPAADPDETKP